MIKALINKELDLLHEKAVAYGRYKQGHISYGEFVIEFMAIEEDIDEFNTRHPEVRITADTKERSVRQHRVTDEVARMFNGITISPQRRATVMRRQLEDLDEGEFFE